MKSFNKLISLGFEIQPINYTCQGIKIRRKGYAILKDGKEMVTLEPKYYPKDSIYAKDKYLLKGEIVPFGYCTSLQDAVNKILKYI